MLIKTKSEVRVGGAEGGGGVYVDLTSGRTEVKTRGGIRARPEDQWRILVPRRRSGEEKKIGDRRGKGS